MKMRINKKIVKKGLLILLVTCYFLPSLVAAYSGPEWGASVGLSTSGLRSTATNVVKWALSAVAFVAVVMIIYGGWLWMIGARGGEKGEIMKAKKVISGAIIGLVIVLLAWAIVIFVIGVTQNASEGA